MTVALDIGTCSLEGHCTNSVLDPSDTCTEAVWQRLCYAGRYTLKSDPTKNNRMMPKTSDLVHHQDSRRATWPCQSSLRQPSARSLFASMKLELVSGAIFAAHEHENYAYRNAQERIKHTHRVPIKKTTVNPTLARRLICNLRIHGYGRVRIAISPRTSVIANQNSDHLCDSAAWSIWVLSYSTIASSKKKARP